MATQTLTLTGFLLARIAEDEALAARIASTTCHGVESNAEDAYFHFTDHAPAECEAKRRLMADHEYTIHRCDGGDMTNHDPDCFIKVTLAAVYSDHPDYREEWKP